MGYKGCGAGGLGASVLLMGLASCASVDHAPELRLADQAMQRTLGVATTWAEHPGIEALEPDASGQVALDRVVRLALTNNRSLRADLEQIGQAKSDWVQAGLLSNPVLSVMAGFPEGGGRADLAFGLSKDIAELWLIPSRKRAAQAMLQERILSFTDRAIELYTEARREYATFQYEIFATQLQDENLKVLEDALAVAQARFSAGAATQLDVNLIRARFLETQIDLIELRSEALTTQRKLLRLMGLAEDTADWAPQPMALQEPFEPLADDEPLWFEIALQQRLDAQAARWELEASMADLEQQRRRVFPSLGVGLSGDRFERRGQTGRDVLADTARASLASGRLTAPDIESASQRRQERSREIDLILGPSLEVPLPIFDQNQAQIAKAHFRARELQERYEEKEQLIVEAVRTALVQRRLAEDRARLYRDSLVPLQQANLRLSKTSYQAGQESILTVLLAQESLIRTRLEYAGAVRDLAIQTAQLERELGGRLPALEAGAAEAGP